MSDTPTLRALIERMRKAASYHHDYHISNNTIEDWADELEVLLSPAEARVPSERPHENEKKDDLSRSPSDGCASATGSPRKPQPEGSQQ